MFKNIIRTYNIFCNIVNFILESYSNSKRWIVEEVKNGGYSLEDPLLKKRKSFFIISKIVFSVILVISFTLPCSSPLGATPLSEKKAEKDRLIKEIYRIHEDLDETVEQYNFYQDELSKVESKIMSLEKRKSILNFRLISLKKELEAALKEIYKHGQANFVYIVSSPDTVNDIIDRMKFFSIAGDKHTQLIMKVKEIRDDIVNVEQEEEKQKKIILGLISELNLAKEQVEEKIREKERLLAKVKQDIQILEREMYKPVTNFVSPSDYTGMVSLALTQQGKPYVWGGSGPNSFDCSGFVYWVFRQFGTYLPRTVRGQYNAGSPVSKSDLRSGDLVFFKNFSHVGIYIGNGNFVHAPHTGTKVRVESLSIPYRVKNYCGACHI